MGHESSTSWFLFVPAPSFPCASGFSAGQLVSVSENIAGKIGKINRTQNMEEKGLGKIPPLLHFMWLAKTDAPHHGFPTHHALNPVAWSSMNSGWRVRTWTNADMLDVLATWPQDVTKAYNTAAIHIAKCDLARWLVLHAHGGVYIDVDFFPVRPLATLAVPDDCDGLLFRQPPDHGNTLFNGFMAFAPQHAFVREFVLFITQRILKSSLFIPRQVLHTTGPFALTDFFQAVSPRFAHLCLLDSHWVLPFSKYDSKKMQTTARRLPQDITDPMQQTVAFTRWHEGSDWVQAQMWERVVPIVVCSAVVFLSVVLVFTLLRRGRRD
jgi:hypothetical protein